MEPLLILTFVGNIIVTHFEMSSSLNLILKSQL